jgi:hypothetical protein
VIGLFPGDEPEPPYQELIKQLKALRLRIVNNTTARARLEYERARLLQASTQGEGAANLAARMQDFTAQIDALNQLEVSLSEQEGQLTTRIRAHDR